MTGVRERVLTAACIASAAVASAGEMDLQVERLIKLRDPFWPVGHQRISESEQMERTKIADLKSRINWPALPLRGVTHAGGRKFIAVIEGAGLVEAGDIVTIRNNALTYRWRIDKVTPEGVVSTRLDVTENPDAKPDPAKLDLM